MTYAHTVISDLRRWMSAVPPLWRRSAVAGGLLGLATASFAETVSLHYSDAEITHADTATFEMEGLGVGTLTYENAAAQLSTNGSWYVTSQGVRCRIAIVVRDAEQASVRCEGNYQAQPVRAEVPDGETFVFIIQLIGG